MTGWVLAVTLGVAVALVLGLAMLALGREVRRLRAEVSALAQLARPDRPQPPGPLTADSLTADRAVRRQGPAELDRDDHVLRPTPIGPAEVEPDLSVSRVASVTLSGPLIKVAAFSHGVRRALDEETRMRVAYAFRKELRRQRSVRRKRASARAAGPLRDGGWHP